MRDAQWEYWVVRTGTYHLEHVQRVPAAGAGVVNVVVAGQEEPEGGRSRGRRPGADAPATVAGVVVLLWQIELVSRHCTLTVSVSVSETVQADVPDY